MKKLLHIGCGPKNKTNTTKVFAGEGWKETRLDIDEEVKPDIVTTMTDLSMIKDNEYDAIYSSHNIEHLFAHEVDIALEEFSRVLDNEGEIFITCPDMARAAEEIIKGNFLGVLYESRAGPISAIDILFGHRESLRNGQHHMAHRVGFTLKILLGLLKAHGFNTVAGISDNMDLYVIGLIKKNSDKLAESKLREHLDGLVKV
ncbi:uncharacterized protein METZ01_LOCUS295723 [marine metagenome]|uniref:Methyltransferase type 11 domain-containing protein n=1 Tax=marine metagenome TaxID=408172 RepID=A0A382M1P2_9ZZZZ